MTAMSTAITRQIVLDTETTGFDPKTGDLTMTRYRHVVDEVENFFTELTLEDARAIKPDAQIGDYLTEINVTSPTGLQEVARFDNVFLEKQIWEAIEARVTPR